MGDDSKSHKIYAMKIIPWYKKLWYYLTFREDKIPKPQIVGEIKSIDIENIIEQLEKEIKKEGENK